MNPTRSKNSQSGMTLIEMMIVVMLGLVIMIAAGMIHQGVASSFRMGAHKLVAQQEASLLTKAIDRRARNASDFEIYTVPIRNVPTETGDGLALKDEAGEVFYRFEWDSSNMTLADSTGARITAMSLQSVQFRLDEDEPKTIYYSFHADDEKGNLIGVESAISLRN